jgi:hypothetical protein
MSTMSAPVDAALVQVPLAGRAPHEAHMIIHVSPLPGTSNPEEFFYDPFAGIEEGDFAAAQAFFHP